MMSMVEQNPPTFQKKLLPVFKRIWRNPIVKLMEFSAIFWIHWIFACLKTVCIISSCINTLLINIDRFTGYRTNVSYLIRNGKIYFTEFTQISIRINMGMIFFLSLRSWRLLEAKNTPSSEAKNIMKELIYWKIYHSEFSQISIRINMGMIFFWPQRSWRLLEAKNTPRKPKTVWRSWFIETSV